MPSGALTGITAVVLAAGTGSRFGGRKLLAPLGGRPILQHVLDALADAGLVEIVVVLGDDSSAIETAIDWRSERRVVNPEPAAGLAGSLHIGMDAVDPGAAAALIVLGDQPLLSAATIRSLIAALPSSDPDVPLGPEGTGAPSILVPRYASDRGRNPVLVSRAALGLISEVAGDRGLGPVIAAHPELVLELPVDGANPDVDTRADLAAVVEARWAERVRANRTQVDRLREVPDGRDFYAPVTSLFRADPHRTDENVLDALREIARPDDTWIDIGAGAGRYALPLALATKRVIAVDPSGGMLQALRDGMSEFAITNIDIVEGRWPAVAAELHRARPPASRGAPDRSPIADVALIAHVGYDVEAIGPFVDEMEAAAGRACVAVLMERQPASLADPCWPPVHGEGRIALPALPEFLGLLEARGRQPVVRRMDREARRFATRDELVGFLRRQLWIADDGPKSARFEATVDELLDIAADGTVSLRGVPPMAIGVVSWSPPG